MSARELIKADPPAAIFWQSGDDDNPMGEPALLVQRYSDTTTIIQEERYININNASIPALIKLLREMSSK